MPQAVLGGFLVVHGLITTMIGVGAVANPNSPAITLPSWFSWWPGPFGRSWLFDALNLGTGVSVLGGLVWLTAGLALVVAGDAASRVRIAIDTPRQGPARWLAPLIERSSGPVIGQGLERLRQILEGGGGDPDRNSDDPVGAPVA
jgi:hypothetical protein